MPISNLSAKGADMDTEGTSPEDTSALIFNATSWSMEATIPAVLCIPDVPFVRDVSLVIPVESEVDI